MRRSCSAGSTWMSDARSLDRLGDEQVDELDDRRVLDELGDAGEVVVVVGVFGRGRLHDRVDVAVDAVEPLDRLVDLRRGRDDGAHLGAGRSRGCRRPRTRSTGRPSRRRAGRPPSRSGSPGSGARATRSRATRPTGRRPRSVRSTNSSPTWRGERAHELGFGDRARLDQEPAERLAAVGLLRERRVELGLGEQSFVDEQGAQRRSVADRVSLLLVPTSGLSAALVRALYARSRQQQRRRGSKRSGVAEAPENSRRSAARCGRRVRVAVSSARPRRLRRARDRACGWISDCRSGRSGLRRVVAAGGGLGPVRHASTRGASLGSGGRRRLRRSTGAVRRLGSGVIGSTGARTGSTGALGLRRSGSRAGRHTLGRARSRPASSRAWHTSTPAARLCTMSARTLRRPSTATSTPASRSTTTRRLEVVDSAAGIRATGSPADLAPLLRAGGRPRPAASTASRPSDSPPRSLVGREPERAALVADDAKQMSTRRAQQVPGRR